MTGNFVFSSDEEKKINDILERGIYEIRNNQCLTRKEKVKERVDEEFLKSSIVNMHNSNTNILNGKNINRENEGINKKEFQGGSIINDNLYGLNYDYDNFCKNNINTSNNSDDDKLNYLEKINSNLKKENIGLSINNLTMDRNLTSIAKSSALRNLLDEMKQNNKYLSSSEDECGYSQKFRGFIQQTQQIEQFQQSPRKKNEDESDKNTNKNNIFDTYPDQELREILPTKENKKLSEQIKAEFTITDNSILLKESGLRLNTPDLMKTNTLTPDNSYINDKELMNIPNRFIKSIDTRRTEDENFSQLTDMHSEIKHLQNKIDGLEQKLKNSVNSNSFSNKIDLRSRDKHSYEEFQKNSLNNKNKNILKSSKLYKNCVSDDEVNYKASKKQFPAFAISSFNKNLNNSKKPSFNREIMMKRSLSSNSDKYNSAGSNLRIKNLTAGVVKSKLDYKEKFEKIKENYDSIKNTLIKERQTINQLMNKNKKLLKKEENYDKLFKFHQELKEEHIKMLKKLEESELIRKEQSKLIKSMQREIDMLRGQFDDNVEINPDKIIEEYKHIKNGLIKEKIKDAGKEQSKVRKISKSKMKSSKNPAALKKFLF